ncbi:MULTISPECIES: glycerate kinase type-2 family protein [unclassified Xanthobacter]|uniref:glycerate kinase type-2 family protein n=1 Tax=unclassified Xanthobacter TaxID=2623496 RepID=UPI001EDEC0B8|nr:MULTISPECIES: glycerate kinase [unclassified Xanthobacter]
METATSTPGAAPAILRALFAAALAAATPEGKFAGRLPAPPKGRTLVVGAGKAAARMARAFEAEWDRPCTGLVITRYGHGCPTRSIEVVEAGHPVPDAAGLSATRRLLDIARSAGADDLVVCLISGGASALLTAPAPGLTLADKQALNTALLRSGAPIGVMNTVRKAVSAVKGGRLAAAIAPARCVTYLISDVPGDDPAVIGSGPTVPRPSDPEAVLALLGAYGIAADDRLAAAIRANARLTAPPVAPTEAALHLIATPFMALQAAAAQAQALGIAPVILGDAIEGEARAAGTVLAGIARAAAAHGQPAAAPCVLLSGGETTVRVTGRGRGGRNSEFLLALTLALEGLPADGPAILALAADTDGIDGSADNAGAWSDSRTLARAQALGLDPRRHLADNDAYGLFATLDQLVVTGPTLTNVNDFRAILVLPRAT